MLNEFSSIFQDEINPGEHLLWTGQPQKGLFLRPADIFIIPFSIFWTGFAVFWEFTALQGEAPIFFTLFGLPFILIGLYLLVARFFVDVWIRSKTYYAVTDQRVIILSGIFNRGVTSISLKNIPDMHLTVQGDGRGTITFGSGMLNSSWGYMGSMNYRRRYPQVNAFERIENVRQVYQLIQRAQNDLDTH